PQQQQQQLADVTNQHQQQAAIHDEDEVLIGLLRLAQHLMQRCPQLKAGIHANFMRDRHLPKCKSTAARSNAIDLLVELAKRWQRRELLLALVDWLQLQHTQHCHDPYGWDYWPQDEGRAACGYVGITNLGATCYMATCLQHLFMIPQARRLCCRPCNPVKHAEILAELKKLFAFLQESQRRALNPRGFCRTRPVKDLFLAAFSPTARVSQDCPHVRHTLEEFYCVRCEVHGVKNLYQSLDKLCVTDLLEGENMYRCSGCDCKVKAEKRVMFKKLPKILCLKYNAIQTHSPTEPTRRSHQAALLTSSSSKEKKSLTRTTTKCSSDWRAELPTVAEQEAQGFVYELNWSDGTADGGHYYSYIRDRLSPSVGDADRWLWFNDSEVRPFDPSQIPDRFMDFSFERTNSAYMLLFYEHVPQQPQQQQPAASPACLGGDSIIDLPARSGRCRVCAYLRNTVPSDDQVFFKTARLTCSFILETLVHAKEKLNLVQWIEIMDKMLILCRASPAVPARADDELSLDIVSARHGQGHFGEAG
uniref:USP domain-containing protein n=1 Tax=Macrostomum lignano TaxID=282301 RepID=A0A1I8JQ15_9PLAT